MSADTSQPFRLPSSGRIDRSRRIEFTFDGRRYAGHPGDTLASALIANGVRLVARSFKYHRPRGIFSAGPEEPNALVQLRKGARTEPNVRATMIELFDGLDATSQNRWPSLAFDLRAIHQAFAALMPSGFYYKTFMWPKSFWMRYEHAIRSAAGMGEAPRDRDPDHYTFEYAHCDVLVVGSGPSGLSAALAAAESGARVVLADERAELGGSLLWESDTIDDMPAALWASRAIDRLAAFPNVRLLPRSTVFGYYDHDLIGIAERVTDHLASSPEHMPRQRLIHLRARRVILATGSIERPLIFPDNDRPGTMLASAIRTYINQYAVLPGRRIAIATNNDSAYRTAFAAKAAGASEVTVVDTRASIDDGLGRQLRAVGIAQIPSAQIVAVDGRSVRGISVAAGGTTLHIACDVIGSSGGWNPTAHLFSQSGGKLRFEERISSFVPDRSRQSVLACGAANGAFTLEDALDGGTAAGVEAARHCGFEAVAIASARCASEPTPTIGLAIGLVIGPEVGPGIGPGIGATPGVSTGSATSSTPATLADNRRGKRFVDIQDDVTVDDIALAHRENFLSVEHLKRYTTLGMGTDQGKTSNVNGLAILAALRNEPIPAVGTTTFRPPYTPMTMGLFAGADTGQHSTPARLTAAHAWHVRAGAPMTTVGHWLRPKTYMQPGESYDAAWRRENLAVRNACGIVDVGTLGKIDVQGPDATTFLQRVYCNNIATLAIDRIRYGLMLREDGLVMDDGTIARLSANHYLVTTTTVNAAKVQSQFEFLLQLAWPELRCHAVSVTEQFAQFALAGPRSRDVLAALLPGVDVSNDALPHLGVLSTVVDGVPLNVYRMSYSGERAYELAIGADYGIVLWERVLECGKLLGIVPYGTEAMGVLRIEKGHVTGNELDGRTTAADVGMGRLARADRRYIGGALSQRVGLLDPQRPSLVGLVAIDGKSSIRAGAHLVADEAAARGAAPNGAFVAKQGYVSSATPSEFLGHSIALAFVERGHERHGEELIAASPLSGEFTRVRIGPPVFVDADGSRMKG